MKILQINKFHYLRGGAEKHYLELSELLADKGHEAIHFSMQHPQNLESPWSEFFSERVKLDKFNITNIARFFYNTNASKNLEKLIKKEKPDIAHLHNIYHQLSPSIIRTLKKHNIPTVMTVHDYKVICPNYQLFSQGKSCNKCLGRKYYNCFLKKCSKNSRTKSLLATIEAYLHDQILGSYKLIDQFIAPSNYMRDQFVKFGIDPKKIKTIYNFSNRPKNQSINTNTDDYLLFFGRLSHEKGLNTLIKATADIKKQKLRIVGDGPLYKKLKDEIKEKKLDSRIGILGPRYGNDLEKLIQNAKSIIIPSIWPENMPLTMLESMSMGKVIIASRIGGMTEIIKHGVNGFLVKPNSSDDLILKILDTNNHNLTDISKNAQKDFNWLFNKEQFYDNLIKLYKKLSTK